MVQPLLGGIVMKTRSFLCYIFIMTMMIVLSGCLKGEQTLGQSEGDEEIIGNETEENDDDHSRTNDNNDDNEEGDQNVELSATEMIDRTLYLIDKDGIVAPQTLTIPKVESKEVAKQVITFLIKDGPVTDYLPNGFQAVIPANTEINGLNLLEDGTLII